jgi:chromosomal replication initiation ATPase DnaA
MTIRKIKQNQVDIKVEQLFYSICQFWGTDLSTIAAESRKQDVSAMRKLLWLSGKIAYPDVRFKTLASLTGRKDHHGIMKGIKSAKDLISIGDPVMMKYSKPIEHVINLTQVYEY